jgi:hypothetical protein
MDKGPSNAKERNAVAVYWLQQTAKVAGIGIDQVYTCYKDAGWRLPADLYNHLQVTASTTGYIDTADMGKIKLATHGENLVEHDLPRKKRGS